MPANKPPIPAWPQFAGAARSYKNAMRYTNHRTPLPVGAGHAREQPAPRVARAACGQPQTPQQPSPLRMRPNQEQRFRQTVRSSASLEIAGLLTPIPC